jgi:hypothetical protein
MSLALHIGVNMLDSKHKLRNLRVGLLTLEPPSCPVAPYIFVGFWDFSVWNLLRPSNTTRSTQCHVERALVPQKSSSSVAPQLAALSWPAPQLACPSVSPPLSWPAPQLACPSVGLSLSWPAPQLACPSLSWYPSVSSLAAPQLACPSVGLPLSCWPAPQSVGLPLSWPAPQLACPSVSLQR